MNLKHFTFDEFDCPNRPGTGHKFMDREFLGMLDEARDISRIKFKILSGYITKEYNRKFPKIVSSSPHLAGRAAHIFCRCPRKRLIIVESLSMVGFQRIGLAREYIHVDNDDLKDNMIWFIT